MALVDRELFCRFPVQQLAGSSAHADALVLEYMASLGGFLDQATWAKRAEALKDIFARMDADLGYDKKPGPIKTAMRVVGLIPCCLPCFIANVCFHICHSVEVETRYQEALKEVKALTAEWSQGPLLWDIRFETRIETRGAGDNKRVRTLQVPHLVVMAKPPASAPVIGVVPVMPTVPSIERSKEHVAGGVAEELAKLAAMKQQGLLDDEEFKQAKKTLLAA